MLLQYLVESLDEALYFSYHLPCTVQFSGNYTPKVVFPLQWCHQQTIGHLLDICGQFFPSVALPVPEDSAVNSPLPSKLPIDVFFTFL